MAPSPGMLVVQDDPVALAEIELCGELMIAASAADEERLSFARIDEVLEVARDREPVHPPKSPVHPLQPLTVTSAAVAL
ncbi:hypothetical protein SAMN05216251_124132 [Actinacidiphila alni]|uniref:Uncharacterized protein n=1 Tax=Actinacidiphila alni TaxID=380248 RepID=A0A1I2KT57_9ACTN|nr:hypothetical protein [Actinacidiphila alni]SFF69509.1 hypothetical protein SAMN05216251_124132 [Actinacidiphila alni]